MFSKSQFLNNYFHFLSLYKSNLSIHKVTNDNGCSITQCNTLRIPQILSSEVIITQKLSNIFINTMWETPKYLCTSVKCLISCVTKESETETTGSLQITERT